MNWQKEPSEHVTLTRSGFEALVQKIIVAIAQPDMHGDIALNILKDKFGIAGALSFSPHWGEEGQRWEHPLITAHNKRCGSRGILNQGFFGSGSV